MALPKQVQAQVHVAEEYDKQVAAAQLVSILLRPNCAR